MHRRGRPPAPCATSRAASAIVGAGEGGGLAIADCAGRRSGTSAASAADASRKTDAPAAAGPVDPLRSLAALHDEVDREARALALRHADRLQCRRGCHACCVDELTVTRIEAERIRRAHPELLATGTPHPIGACAFLDAEGACRIYAERPLVCRSQGLPLQLFFEDEVGEIEERRDICPLNLEGGPPLERLPDDALWLVGVHELRLAAIDEAAGGSDETRVGLRALFVREA